MGEICFPSQSDQDMSPFVVLIRIFYIFFEVYTLRVPDCNFRESLAKLEKSKLLIICLKFTFGELSSKILFECSGNL